jgi:hypothetical protein
MSAASQHRDDTRTEPDQAMLRELAVKAGVDPRTILNVLRGKAVRGMPGRRAREVLVERGLLPADGGAL